LAIKSKIFALDAFFRPNGSAALPSDSVETRSVSRPAFKLNLFSGKVFGASPMLTLDGTLYVSGSLQAVCAENFQRSGQIVVADVPGAIRATRPTRAFLRVPSDAPVTRLARVAVNSLSNVYGEIGQHTESRFRQT